VMSFLLVDGYTYSQSFCVFFGVVTASMFSSVNKLLLTSLGEYFSATVLNGCVLHGNLFHSALGRCEF